MTTCTVLYSHLPSNSLDANRGDVKSLQDSYCDSKTSSSYGTKLPPEIWLKIFDSLCYIPGVLELSNGHTIEAFSEDNEGILLHGLYHESMRAKLAISCVSWTWRRIVMPLLFEYVMIRSAAHARVVAEALTRLRRQQGDADYCGRWIKRVEIVLQDHFWEEECIDAVADVLSQSPNILVFSDFFSVGRLPTYATRGIVKKLQYLCENGRLRRIESCGAIIPRLHKLLCATPSLEVLITKQLTSCPVSLPNLHTLVIGKMDTIFACELENLRAPNLQNLIMHTGALDPLPSCCATRNNRFFPNLRHLRCLRINEKFSLFHVADIPGLTSLTVDFGRKPSFEDLEKYRIKHPTIERIELIRFPIFNPKPRTSCDIGEQLFVSGFLWSLLKKEDNPSLQTIAFLRPRSYFDAGDFAKREIKQERIADYEFWDKIGRAHV